MSQSLVKVNLHIVFSTKYRKDWIQNDISGEVYSYLVSIGKDCGSFVYKIGGTKNHIHIACTLPKTITVSSLLEHYKTSSSKWIKTKGSDYSDFAWQNGYAAFSVGQSQIDTLIKYINNQHVHHHKKTFEEELVELFKVYNVEYDEKFLWD
ncbi:MAG: IS200/IS605 family transposase [Fibrobacter sp.]|nr:IS200/IS605 family transposase [Fibrobacter sp.]